MTSGDRFPVFLGGGEGVGRVRWKGGGRGGRGLSNFKICENAVIEKSICRPDFLNI